ncbi:MAG: hypothetical protein KAK00_07035 [Nanoarchaeota archaeon]|nr:hypothetical protein [Nanoarchaeota archaeon]
MLEIMTIDPNIHLVNDGTRENPKFTIQVVNRDSRIRITKSYLLSEWGMDLINTPQFFREDLKKDHFDFANKANEVLSHYGMASFTVEPVIENSKLQKRYESILMSIADDKSFEFYSNHLEKIAGLMSRFQDYRVQGAYPEYSTLIAQENKGYNGNPIAGNYSWAAALFLFRASDTSNHRSEIDLENAVKLYSLSSVVELGELNHSPEYLHDTIKSNSEWYMKFADNAEKHLDIIKKVPIDELV